MNEMLNHVNGNERIPNDISKRLAKSLTYVFPWKVTNLHGLCGRFTRLRVDGKRNRENIYPVLNLHGYVWTGPNPRVEISKFP